MRGGSERDLLWLLPPSGTWSPEGPIVVVVVVTGKADLSTATGRPCRVRRLSRGTGVPRTAVCLQGIPGQQ
jgi:hypothetical protein